MNLDMRVEGVVKQGLRRASGLAKVEPGDLITETIRKQKPFFAEVVPGIVEVYNGTINVDIGPKVFELTSYDHGVACEWERGFDETFWFVRAGLRHDGLTHDAWIYYPCPGPLKAHTTNTVFELLAPKIEGLQYGDKVEIFYSSERVRID